MKSQLMYAVIVDTGGHPNMPSVELEFHWLYEDQTEADRQADILNDHFAEMREQDGDDIFDAMSYAHVVKMDLSKITLLTTKTNVGAG